MRLVKRTAITLKPKQPYLDWANHLDNGPKIDAETSSEASIYLLEDDSGFEFDLEALLKAAGCGNSVFSYEGRNDAIVRACSIKPLMALSNL